MRLVAEVHAPAALLHRFTLSSVTRRCGSGILSCDDPLVAIETLAIIIRLTCHESLMGEIVWPQQPSRSLVNVHLTALILHCGGSYTF